jgi:hypothetical protein
MTAFNLQLQWLSTVSGHDDDFVVRSSSLTSPRATFPDPLTTVRGDDVGAVEAIAARPEAKGTTGLRLYGRRKQINCQQWLGPSLGGRAVRWRCRRNPLVFLQRTSLCRAPYFTGAGIGLLAGALCWSIMVCIIACIMSMRRSIICICIF